AGYRRAANILRAEEKKESKRFAGAVLTDLLKESAETDLAAALEDAQRDAGSAVRSENFESAMASLAHLRAPLDAFFEGILVNVDDTSLRENRLHLLNDIRTTMHSVADFSRIEG
ncbi:MAG: DALR anticodon-binding domain-containing protein, partial [Pseudomonadota bacterium]